MNDDVVALLALHARSLGLLPGLDDVAWLLHMARDGLYGEHWLLAYEALHHNLLPSVTGNNYVRGAVVFGSLRKNGVCFYDETATINTPAPRAEESSTGHAGIKSMVELVAAHRDAFRLLQQEQPGLPAAAIPDEDLY